MSLSGTRGPKVTEIGTTGGCCGQKPTGEQRRATQESREQLRAAAGPGPSERRPAKTPARTSDAGARACHLTYTWSGR